MVRAQWRFAVAIAATLAAVTLVVAWVYDLPVRDPDNTVAGPTYVRFPLILFVAFLVDVLPRAFYRARNPLHVVPWLREVVRERWTITQVRYAMVGLAAWYVIYASFRNLKSFVPFVNGHLWDGVLDNLDRLIFLDHDPAQVLHGLLGTGLAAHVLSFVYIAWIVFIPASLVVALALSRDIQASTWYVTAIGVDWVLGVATYYAVPTLGPVYARPELFAGLDRTDVTGLQVTMMHDRHAVLVNPFTTDAVQTIAAFASLHVGMCVTMCVMAELLRFRVAARVFLWVFLGLTIVATVYLGWHYFVDTMGGAVIGVAGVWIAARGTGNAFRRRPVAQELVSAPATRAA